MLFIWSGVIKYLRKKMIKTHGLYLAYSTPAMCYFKLQQRGFIAVFQNAEEVQNTIAK
jgi:hypothetical protein